MKQRLTGAVTLAATLLTLSLSAATYPISEPIKSIPLPPAGQRWILNEHLSDEFNDTKLNQDKWLDHHPTWKGRAPGLFMPSNIEFKDGCMVLRGEKMERDTTVNGEIFDTSCAAVISKDRSAHYGYYECRFKANQTTLSSTFWFSTRGSKDTKGRQPEGAAPGAFAQELDVCECIGRDGDFMGRFFYDGMNSNVHYWFSPEDGSARQDIRIKETRLRREDGAKPSEGFNTYGVWWRDSECATFYLNDGEGEHREFKGRPKHSGPFDIDFRLTEPMSLHMVVETYPFPWIPLPTDEELADPTRNRTYYDWVRSYLLVDADEKNNGAAEMTMFEDQINIASKPSSITKGDSLEIHYTAGVDREIMVVVYNEKGKIVATKSISALAGYGNIELEIPTSKKVTDGSSYSIVAYLGAKSSKLTADYLSGDSFSAKISK